MEERTLILLVHGDKSPSQQGGTAAGSKQGQSKRLRDQSLQPMVNKQWGEATEP